MKVNIHWIERFLRIVIGAGLIAWALGLLGMFGLGQGPVWAWIGAVPLLTGLIGWWENAGPLLQESGRPLMPQM